MIKSMLFFIAVLIVALGARPVLAGDEREYVDHTTILTPPDVGIIRMHDLCRAEFRKTAPNMCSTGDIVRNGGRAANLPVIPAWVHPSRVIQREAAAVAFTSYDSASGASVGTTGLQSCFGWISANSNTQGMTLNANGKFSSSNCDIPRQVACCGPTVPDKRIFQLPPR